MARAHREHFARQKNSIRRSGRILSLITCFIVHLAASLVCSVTLAQQPFDFFWSTAEPGSGNVVNQDLLIDVLDGKSQTLFLYYTTDGPSGSELRFGGGLEVATSDKGVVRFDSAETFNFEIEAADGTPIGLRRWTNAIDTGGHFGPADVVTDEFIDQFDFFTILGTGIVNENTGPGLFDAGYDSAADAFLIGSIEFTGLSNGTVALNTTVGDPISLSNDGFTALKPVFGSVMVNVVDRFTFENGTLAVMGTNENDVIVVDQLDRGMISLLVNDCPKEIFEGVCDIIIEGMDGNDIITTNVRNTTIHGGDGDDQLTANGQLGAIIFGEAGNDTIVGGLGRDELFGGEGDDNIDGRNGSDMIDGGSPPLANPGVNTLRGGRGSDVILGGIDVDMIMAGDGADQIFGFDGDDTILGGNGFDVISAGIGNDFVSGGRGSDDISGGPGNDEINGGDGQDVIRGGIGNDVLNGNRSHDILEGGGGDDMLCGGEGNDELHGGSGIDTATDSGEVAESGIENSAGK